MHEDIILNKKYEKTIGIKKIKVSKISAQLKKPYRLIM